MIAATVAALFTGCTLLVKQHVVDLMPPDRPYSEVAHGLVLASEFWARYWWSFVALGIFVGLLLRQVAPRYREGRDDRAWVTAHPTPSPSPTPIFGAKVYRLRMTFINVFIWYVFPVVVTLLGSLAAVAGGGAFGGLLFLAFGIMWVRRALRMPVEISVSDAGDLALSGIVGRRTVPAGAVRSLRPVPRDPDALVLKHDGGRIELSKSFDDLPGFVEELRLRNPQADIQVN